MVDLIFSASGVDTCEATEVLSLGKNMKQEDSKKKMNCDLIFYGGLGLFR